VHLTAGNIERTARGVERVKARRDIPVIDRLVHHAVIRRDMRKRSR
jgi:hypothetical protein